MSRFLFVVPPLVGHINPTIGVAARLKADGHEVGWVGPTAALAALFDVNAAFLPSDRPLPEFQVAGRPPQLRGFASLKFLWEEFLVPLADTMVALVDAAVDEFRPDALLVDQQALAGALVAERRDIPWATSATTSAELLQPLAEMPKVAAWLDDLLAGLRQRHGSPTATHDLRFSPHGVLAFSTEELVGPVDGKIVFVGPSINARPDSTSLPELDGRPVVLVSLGTANAEAGEKFLRTAIEALAEMPDYQGVVVDPTGEVTDVRRVPQLALLPRCAVVVCHAGHNTVCETLSHGVPLVVAPIRDDQPIVAQQVVDAGAGVRVRFGRVTADQLRAAITEALDHAEGARRIQRSFASAGGAGAAANWLSELAATRTSGLKR
ncbi:glycosyltransferase [Kutzneria buriramensis]|uniref:MGT family glycosyltransferase n=1 Tax=Kutzneria buriramensis TaxID=1045776 RepID=A0A3E0IAT3_9PSEU|nr:glycosyltransferase [Kutzneria buriramensis]REH55255.1 MGT family glycosyltransferase [Kutzneria buriramensis]